MSTSPAPTDRPVLRLIRGDATDEEIAAIVAVVAAAAGAGGAVPSAGDDDTTSVWAEHSAAHRHVRGSFASGPHGWRTSFWPR